MLRTDVRHLFVVGGIRVGLGAFPMKVARHEQVGASIAMRGNELGVCLKPRICFFAINSVSSKLEQVDDVHSVRVQDCKHQPDRAMILLTARICLDGIFGNYRHCR
jgi:hypothetical protein